MKPLEIVEVENVIINETSYTLCKFSNNLYKVHFTKSNALGKYIDMTCQMFSTKDLIISKLKKYKPEFFEQWGFSYKF